MKKKIIIVGGGIIGCLSALYFAKKKYKVSIYDKDSKLGGVLKEYTDKKNLFLKGTQYFNTDTEWFALLKKLFPKSFNIFPYRYGTYSDLNDRVVFSSKFSLPIIEIPLVEERNLLIKKKKINTLKDRINLYPKSIYKKISKFLKNCEINPSKFSHTCSNNLQISRVHVLGKDKLIDIYKKKNKINNDLYALERKKIFDDKLHYAYPSQGYTLFFNYFLKKLKSLNVDIYLKTRLEPKWVNNKLKLKNNGIEVKNDFILWTGNPSHLIKAYNNKKIESYVFRNIQVNSNLINKLEHNKFIQIYNSTSSILRIHLYKINHVSKISIECLFKKIDAKKILNEAKNILETFGYKINFDNSSVNKKISSRFDILTLKDENIIKNFQKSTRRSNLLYTPWNIYGRDLKMFKILNYLKKISLI